MVWRKANSSPHYVGNANSGHPLINTPRIPAQRFRREQLETWLATEEKEAQVTLLDQARRAAEVSGALD